jgi:hypothetical protein
LAGAPVDLRGEIPQQQALVPVPAERRGEDAQGGRGPLAALLQGQLERSRRQAEDDQQDLRPAAEGADCGPGHFLAHEGSLVPRLSVMFGRA